MVEPTSKVEYDDSRLAMLTKVEDGDDITPPPFSILHIDAPDTFWPNQFRRSCCLDKVKVWGHKSPTTGC
jgi:hypothetical protein